jgi:putative flippase GtrA
MSTRTQPAPDQTRREVGGFIVVGILAVILDFGVFNALLLLDFAVWAANAIALLLSMTFAFVGNYRWTFAHRQVKSLLHAYTAFASINVLAVLFIEAVVVIAESGWSPDTWWLNAVKAGATAVATVARFFAYKRWVFF